MIPHIAWHARLRMDLGACSCGHARCMPTSHAPAKPLQLPLQLRLLVLHPAYPKSTNFNTSGPCESPARIHPHAGALVHISAMLDTPAHPPVAHAADQERTSWNISPRLLHDCAAAGTEHQHVQRPGTGEGARTAAAAGAAPRPRRTAPAPSRHRPPLVTA